MSSSPECLFPDGHYSVPQRLSRILREYPFAYLGDGYTSTFAPAYLQDVAAYTPRLAARTSYTNLLTYSEDLTNAAWASVIGGAGISATAVVSASPAPAAGLAVFRIQADCGDISSAANGSYWGQELSGLANAHDACASLWVKSNISAEQKAIIYTGNGSTGQALITVTPTWQRVDAARAGVAATTDLFRIGTRGATGSDQAIDILVAAPQFETAAAPGPYIPTTDTARTISAPDWFDDASEPDPFAYLIAEGKPRLLGNDVDQGHLCTYTRTFARIPAQNTRRTQVIYGRPSVPSTGADRSYGAETTANAGYFYQPDTNLNVFHAYSRRAIGADQGVANTPTGGTAILTHGADSTTGQAYNVAAATLKTALDALASVTTYGGLATLTGNYNDAAGFIATFADYAFMTVDLSALTGGSAGSSPIITGLSPRRIQNCYFTHQRTGGTWAITLFGQTTSGLAITADIAAISAAVNALSNVTARGGCIVSGPGYSYPSGVNTTQFTLTFADIPTFTATSSLTPAPSSVVVTPSNNGWTQTIKFTGTQTARVLTFTNPHGMTAGASIYLKMGATYYRLRTDWTYLSTTQISVNPSLAPWSTNTAITEGGVYRGRYAPGSTAHAARIVSDYYLPGVTPGITTAEDIPLPPDPINDAAYLDAVVNGTDYIAYGATAPDNWLGSAILVQSVTSIKIPRP